jgi:iron complex transport system substrate-binding protein
MEDIFYTLDEESQERIDIIRHKLKFIEKKPVVVCIESLEPFIIAADSIPGMLEIAGGIAFQPAADNSWESIRSHDPEIIVVMPRGLSVEQTMKEMNLLLQQPGFSDLKAVKNNRVYIADGSQYFYQPGQAVVNAVEILAEIIHPKQFIFGYEDSGWIKFAV